MAPRAVLALRLLLNGGVGRLKAAADGFNSFFLVLILVGGH